MTALRSEHDLRCVCARQPILAKYGFDRRTREVFVHVKRWKQDRLLCEVIVTSGTVRLHCPVCLRWLIINIKSPKPQMSVEELPESLVV
jgi:hypothetical protein